MNTGWTAVALSAGLRVGGVMRSFVDGKELAVWRSASGKVAAWDNRCPHRGMRLSHGFVRGEQLACLYHGWHYGQDGVCSYIPAHPDLEPPKTICAQVFPCVEADGFVWVNGDPSDLPRGFAPDMVPLRSIYVDLPREGTVAALTGVGAVAAHRDDLFEISGVAGTDALIAIQANGAGQTVLHIGAPKGTNADTLIEMSCWAEAFRCEAEAKELA